jgi:predicted nucleotidyltransferase
VGAVGVVEVSPTDATHRYQVRFPDGGMARLRRDEMVVYRLLRGQDLLDGGRLLADRDLGEEHVVFRCVTGSRAYGLDREGSDVDRRGVYLPPADLHWSLYGVPQQLESKETEECYWELGKFLLLALKANPNILECLWSPLVERVTPVGEELLEIRDAFLSRLAYQTYNGYALSQFKKLEQDLRVRGKVRWKHAMHLLRLLLGGIELMRERTLRVDVSDFRERLLKVRDGEVPWDEVDLWRKQLHQELDKAYATTLLPERPDYDRVNAFLIRARRSAL